MAETPVNLTDAELEAGADYLRNNPDLLNRLDSDTRRRWDRFKTPAATAGQTEDTIVGLRTDPQSRAERINRNLEEQQAITKGVLLGMPASLQAASIGAALAGKGLQAAGATFGEAPWYIRTGLAHLLGMGPKGYAVAAAGPTAMKLAGKGLEAVGNAGRVAFEAPSVGAGLGAVATAAGAFTADQLAVAKALGKAPEVLFPKGTPTRAPTRPAAPPPRQSLPLVDKIEAAGPRDFPARGRPVASPTPVQTPPAPTTLQAPPTLPDLAGTNISVTGEEAIMAQRWLRQGISPDQIVRRILATRALQEGVPSMASQPTGAQMANAVADRNAGVRLNQWEPMGNEMLK